MKRAILISSLLAAISAGMLFLINKPASAANLPQFQADNIISDIVFTNNGSMSAADIQAFLNQKNAVCLKDFRSLSLHDDNGNGSVQDSTTEQYGPDTMSAAELIKAAADIYRINPKVLLVTLQKEQGLITTTDCAGWKYNTALGYGCPDTAPCDQAAYGFTRQIDYGTYHLRGFFDDSLNSVPYTVGDNRVYYHPGPCNTRDANGNCTSYHDITYCGSTVLNIKNRATASLYSYTPYQPNQASLNAGYGLGDSCSSYGNRNFFSYFNDWFGSTHNEQTLISYKSHVAEIGWTGNTINNGITGTTGQGKTMQAFKINGEVEYSSYSNVTGWQPTINNGMISGTTGLSRPIQAVKLNPTGSLASKYDLYYRVHASNVGWMGWTKNGAASGVTGDNTKNIEAIEIQLVLKGDTVSGTTANSFQNFSTTTYNPPISLQVTSHVSDVGWQPTVTDAMVSGTTEQTKRLEAFKVNLNNTSGLTGNINYSAHVSDIGWQDIKSNNEVAGTTGQSRRVEAVRLALTGSIADNYDIWYRGYVQYMGWLDWTKNGAPAGSMGASRQLEAIEVRLTAKNQPGPTSDGTGLYNPKNVPLPDTYFISYATHLSNIGWISGVKQNEVGGTTGQTRSMEAVRFDTSGSLFGLLSVDCTAYVRGLGWQASVPRGTTCGTTGQSRPLEAVKLSLSGETASKYDIYYRVHLSYRGWQDWVKNGEQAGIIDPNKQIEAIIIRLVKK